MVISLLIFEHRGPELGVVESAGWIAALVSPLCGILAIEISQMLRQTACLRRVQVLLNLLNTVGSCATAVMMVLSFMATNAELQSTVQICDDGEHALLLAVGSNSSQQVSSTLMRDCGKNSIFELIFWCWLILLGAFGAGFTCVSSLVFTAVSQRESGGSYGREATLLLRQVETRDACGVDDNAEEGSFGEESGQGGDTIRDSEGDSATHEVTVMGVSKRGTTQRETPGIRSDTREPDSWRKGFMGAVEGGQQRNVEGEALSMTDVDILMGREDRGGEKEKKGVVRETQSSITEKRVDASQWREKGRKRMCKVMLGLMMVCLSCILALHLAWREGDRQGEGESMGVMRRCNGADFLCRMSYDKVSDVVIFHWHAA